LLRLALADWNIHDIIDNALNVTAELVANALKLGDVFHLTVTRQGGTVLIQRLEEHGGKTVWAISSDDDTDPVPRSDLRM
jgi:hypothetical protein